MVKEAREVYGDHAGHIMTHLQQPPLTSSSCMSTFWLSIDGRVTRISGNGVAAEYWEKGAGDCGRGLLDSNIRTGGDNGDGDDFGFSVSG